MDRNESRPPSDGADPAPPRNAVVPVEGGPLRVRGDLDVRPGTGEQPTRETSLVLCRCGRSDDRPFCDGSPPPTFDADGVDPNDASDAVVAASERTGNAEAAHDPLVVTLRRNGPVHLAGPAVLVRTDGERSMDETALCRCGASRQKPFCDGTHESLGFTTDPDE